MSLFSLSETNKTIKYGLQASQVNLTLKVIQNKKGVIDDKDREVLNHGLKLLDEFMRSSKLIEGEDVSNIHNLSSDNIIAFRYALTTLQILDKIQKTQQASEVLGPIQESLSNIISGKKSSKDLDEELNNLREFFNALSSSFYNDIVKARIVDPQERHFELKSYQKDESSLATAN